LRFSTELFSESYSSLLKTTGEFSGKFRLMLVFTIARALVLRLNPRSNSVLEQLTGLLESQSYGSEMSRLAASGFRTLLEPDDILSKTNHARIRLLAPQRVFQVLTPLIALKFRQAADATDKQNYLTALTGIISTLSPDIVLPELPTLFPLLLQSLDLSDQRVKLAVLQTFVVVISTASAALEESGHVPSLVKRLLATALSQDPAGKNTTTTNLPSVRQLAVRCLLLMPAHTSGESSRPNPLLPLKKEVLGELVRVLDDQKRDVRREAVDARAAWLRGLDEVNEDEESE